MAKNKTHGGHIPRIILGILALVIVLAAYTGVVAAQSVTLDPAEGAPGTQVTAHGSGWGAQTGDTAEAIWGSTSGPVVGTGMIQSGGTFIINFTVPQDATPGTYQVWFQAPRIGGAGIPATFQKFTVTPPTSPPTPAPTPAPTFNISGFKVNSATGSGIPNWNITLMNSTMHTSMLTGSDGSYKFMKLVNGTYNVTEETKSGFTNVSPTTVRVTINGSDVMNINFTNTPVTPVKLGSISGTKFNDSDGDGIKDANESGLANWIITLSNSSTGAAIFNTTTANDGSYKFSNLSAGDYTVGEVLKSGWKQTAPPTGTYSVTITSAGEDVTGKDFGNMLVPPPPPSANGSISGLSINTATGKGLPNWTIRLVGIVGTGVDTKEIRKETMTDSEGRWMFDNLPEGSYIIIVQIQKGFIPVSPPVMNLMLAKGQNSMKNNFTNRPVESLIPTLPLSPPTSPVT